MNIAVVGGGVLCRNLMDLIEEHTFRELSPRIVAVLETAVETARLGAVNYLAKPFTPDEIRGVTEEAIQLAA